MSPFKQAMPLLRLPIASYLIGFFSIAALLYALVAGWMLQKSEEISRFASRERTLSAHHELTTAMHHVGNEVQDVLNRLKDWEEIYQQLDDPNFYEYWRGNRALMAGYTPEYLVALELYDREGNILQARPGATLPAQRPPQDRAIQLVNGRPYLSVFSALTNRDDTHQIIGHVGIKIDLHRALLALNRFIYVDSNSIVYPLLGSPANLTELLTFTRFVSRPIAETQQLEGLMRGTLMHFSLLALLLLLLAYLLTSHLLHRPLRKLSRYIDELRNNRIIHSQPPATQRICVAEFENLKNSIVNYQLELEDMHSSLDQKNRELWNLAHHDALTGAPNRRAYDDDWHQLQQLIHGQRITLSMILIDCDHFKAINDSYGHDVGDQVLQTIAECLRHVLRHGDRYYRLGGDEFAIHLLNTEQEMAQQLALRCQQQLEQYDFKQLGIREPVRFSMGLAAVNGEDTTNLRQLHKQADIAMYQAKRPGSSKIVCFTPELASSASSLTSNRFINAIYRAIEKGDGIELHFQPIVSLQDGQQGLHEVLLRLRDTEGLIYPANIFPIIDAEGLAVELDYAVLQHLAAQLDTLGAKGYGCLSINIDGDTLMHHNFIAQIAILEPYLQRHPGSIVLEITETALIAELKEAHSRLQQLRQRGFTIALDDFGSGYSSLRYLASMPVDIIKFDTNLIHDLESTTGQAEITADLAHMIRRAGYLLIAEGIENRELLDKVVSLGFTHVQGFLFGRPCPAPIDKSTLQQYEHSLTL